MKARAGVVLVICLGLGQATVFGGYATDVVNYVQGTGLGTSEAKFNDPHSALGEPARMTGIGVWPGPVTVFNSVFSFNQAVSLGEGGSLTVHFGTPITDDSGHLYGVDLMVFGNAGFIDADWPNATVGTEAGLFGPGNGKVEVSADGVNFYEIPNAFADQLFPTQGYLDRGAYDSAAGSVPSNFFKPVNPALTLQDFAGKTYSEILAMYDGSGGGLPIDLAWAVNGSGQPAGLTSASYVRVSQMGVGDTQVEAFVAIPEPTTLGFVVLMAAGLVIRRSVRA
jgi:hypothetical protein